MASVKMESIAYVLLSSVALTGYCGVASSSSSGDYSGEYSEDVRGGGDLSSSSSEEEEPLDFGRQGSGSFVTRHAPSARHRVLMMIGHHASSSHSSHAHGSLPAGKSDQADVGHGAVSNDIAGGSGGTKTIATTSAAQELAALVQAADPTVALDIARALMRIKSIDAVVDIGVLAAALVAPPQTPMTDSGADVDAVAACAARLVSQAADDLEGENANTSTTPQWAERRSAVGLALRRIAATIAAMPFGQIGTLADAMPSFAREFAQAIQPNAQAHQVKSATSGFLLNQTTTPTANSYRINAGTVPPTAWLAHAASPAPATPASPSPAKLASPAFNGASNDDAVSALALPHAPTNVQLAVALIDRSYPEALELAHAVGDAHASMHAQAMTSAAAAAAAAAVACACSAASGDAPAPWGVRAGAAASAATAAAANAAARAASTGAAAGQFPAALLSAAAVHAHFGHIRLARQALSEATRGAQQAHDDGGLCWVLLRRAKIQLDMGGTHAQEAEALLGRVALRCLTLGILEGAIEAMTALEEAHISSGGGGGGSALRLGGGATGGRAKAGPLAAPARMSISADAMDGNIPVVSEERRFRLGHDMLRRPAAEMANSDGTYGEDAANAPPAEALLRAAHSLAIPAEHAVLGVHPWAGDGGTSGASAGAAGSGGGTNAVGSSAGSGAAHVESEAIRGANGDALSSAGVSEAAAAVASAAATMGSNPSAIAIAAANVASHVAEETAAAAYRFPSASGTAAAEAVRRSTAEIYRLRAEAYTRRDDRNMLRASVLSALLAHGEHIDAETCARMLELAGRAGAATSSPTDAFPHARGAFPHARGDELASASLLTQATSLANAQPHLRLCAALRAVSTFDHCGREDLMTAGTSSLASSLVGALGPRVGGVLALATLARCQASSSLPRHVSSGDGEVERQRRLASLSWAREALRYELRRAGGSRCAPGTWQPSREALRALSLLETFATSATTPDEAAHAWALLAEAWSRARGGIARRNEAARRWRTAQGAAAAAQPVMCN
ncbi:anaphase-promoting complex subunit 5 [Pseudoscourfieldia marina]